MQLIKYKFIEEFKKFHGNKYDYSKVNYINARTKITIICPEHGEFEQLPYNHKRGNGCPKCLYNKKNNKTVIKEFIERHGNKYDYSKVNYMGTDEKVIIICPNHGEFEQTPHNHKLGQNCPKCNGKNLKTDDIIKEFEKIHGDKYDYSKVNYINSSTKINIICPEHGEFKQTPNNHKMGQGCAKCNGNFLKDIKTLLTEFKTVHDDKYDYSNVIYKNAHTKINIICPEHGEFKQTPNNHRLGNGCPVCNESKGERAIRSWLDKNNIVYIPQHKFDDCKNVLALPFDFYLPKLNTCIEYNGIQHYKVVEYFGGVEGLKQRKINDKIKMEYCNNNNIPFLIIKYNDNILEKLTTLK
jgi:hypothetical protein